MPKIVIQNLYNKRVATKRHDKKVLDIIHENQIDWMHACGKKGRCTSCKMIVIEGMENLNPVTDREQNYRDLHRLADNERLSCQSTLLKGELVIRVAEKNKFPHMDYSE